MWVLALASRPQHLGVHIPERREFRDKGEPIYPSTLPSAGQSVSICNVRGTEAGAQAGGCVPRWPVPRCAPLYWRLPDTSMMREPRCCQCAAPDGVRWDTTSTYRTRSIQRSRTPSEGNWRLGVNDITVRGRCIEP